MNAHPILTALSSRSIAAWVRQAQRRVVYAAPGIHPLPATALAELASRLPLSSITISLDFDEHTLRMGYGTLEAVEALSAAGLVPTHSPGFRSGILIVDDRGWIFTPTALYLEAEPQSDETPNAVELSPAQVKALAIRLSPAAKKEAIEQAESPAEAQAIAQLTVELGVNAVAKEHMATVKTAIEVAPPVKFDVVLIDACVMESGERMKYEGRMMKWGRWSGAFSSFIIHPSSFLPLLRLTADITEVRDLIQSARRGVASVVDTFQVMTNRIRL